jgi:arabinofuranosyltransferase
MIVAMPRGRVGAAGVVAVLVLVASTGWMADDAYITLRVVDNLWAGYGLRWNVIERVQVFTHPLWMLLLAAAYGVTREGYWTVLVLSLAMTGAALTLLTRRIAAPTASAVIALGLLASSKAFVEYSTSGLENPLTHLVLIAFLTVSWTQQRAASWPLSTFAALATLCRPDAIALVGPLWAAAVATDVTAPGPARLRRVIGSVAGWWPLAAWVLFAWFYYGTPVPNTAYAKLPINVARAELMAQGGWYLLDSLAVDPVTLAVIGLAMAHAIAMPGHRIVGVALASSLAAVVSVGGDHMTGRFLTPAFVVGVAHLARHRAWRPATAAGTVLVALGLGASRPESPLRVWQHARADFRVVSNGHGIVDERALYARHTGVWSQVAGRHPDQHPWSAGGRAGRIAPTVMVFEAVGLLGYHGGPGLHVIDTVALTEPFLARLPADRPWRIGHFYRKPPPGYVETIRHCVALAFPGHAIAPVRAACGLDPRLELRIADPEAAARFRRTALATQAPLTDRRRLATLLGTAEAGDHAR